jgi:hypothetical protein
MSEQGILIAGGYGVVGQRIAAELASDYPVILLHAAIERGLRYTDITPHLMELGRGASYETIEAAAFRERRERSSIVRLLPAGTDDAVRSARRQRRPASARLQRSACDRIPFAVWTASAYLFPFSDQVLYPRTMGARTAITRLAIEPARVARLLAASVRVGAVRLLALERVRHALTGRRSDRGPSDHVRFALRVDITHAGRSAHATLVGGAQADAAAAGASGTVRSLIENEVSEPGVRMPEQVIDAPGFVSYLARHGLTVALPATNNLQKEQTNGSVRVHRRS